MTRHRAVCACGAVLATFVVTTARAQSAPSSPHPRLWLDSSTLAGLAAQVTDPESGVSRGAKRCLAARENPSSYATGGWQGFEFVTTLSGCLVAYKASENPDDLATAIKYWNVLLDDYQTVGDGAGGDDVVTHDTGYAMRTFAPYSALAYDWLHDAPGVTEQLRAHSRARFDAWFGFYETQGYLNDMPGANYQAGYLFAATLIAIAEGGEAGAAGDAHWTTVRDVIWGKDMATALAPGGVLVGGDWPEGWQYGPLSVLEYGLAAKALGDHGLSIPGMEPWANSLVDRFFHGLTPLTRDTFVAGDTGGNENHIGTTNGALLGAILGPASTDAKARARQLLSELDLENENPLFDALAAASGTEKQTIPPDAPRNFLAAGAGNWYVRGDWTGDTVWGVFQCSRRRVDDHQHNDAGNWVLTRGADDVVVDPSPYGTLSTLTGNAPAIDTNGLPPGYSPSQAGWGETTELRWARQSASGIGVARCDYADQFHGPELPGDVAHALRDFVLIPNGANGSVVLVDRAITAGADLSLHLRVRTPTSLTLEGDVASGTLGGSALAIRRAWSSAASANVREMPTGPECSSDNRGTCDASRLPDGWEYRLDVDGPSAFAIHVIDAREAGSSIPETEMLSGTGYRGVLLERDGMRVAVITNDRVDAESGASLEFPVGPETHAVVVDAPVGDADRSAVSATTDGTDCRVTVTPHPGGTGGHEGRPLVVKLTDGCAVVDDPVEVPSSGGATGSGNTSGSGGFPGSSGSSGNSARSDDADVEGYCQLRTGRFSNGPITWLVLGLSLLVFRRRQSGAGSSGCSSP
jgi:hypothetical protein